MMQLAALAAVTPDVEAKVAAWREARAVREAAWDQYSAEMLAHNQRIAREAGRRIRRHKALVLAERRLDPVEHRVRYAEAEIEMALRVANPGTDNPSIMATKRALTGPA